jgi:hypothetical protein
VLVRYLFTYASALLVLIEHDALTALHARGDFIFKDVLHAAA